MVGDGNRMGQDHYMMMWDGNTIEQDHCTVVWDGNIMGHTLNKALLSK